MKPWITVIGICLTLLVGCSKSEFQTSATPTLEKTPAIETKIPAIVPDLKAIPEGTGWNGSIHTAALFEKDLICTPSWKLVASNTASRPATR